MKYKFTNSENNSGVLIQMQADNAWSYYVVQMPRPSLITFWQPVNCRLLYSFLTLILWRVIILLSHFLKHSCLDNCLYINNVLRSRSFSSLPKVRTNYVKSSYWAALVLVSKIFCHKTNANTKSASRCLVQPFLKFVLRRCFIQSAGNKYRC